MADKPGPSPTTQVRSQKRNSSIPLVPQNATQTASTSQPLIPTRIVDAPTQRAYAVAFWAILIAWRFYDWVRLVEDSAGAESTWLFLKWVAIDFAFLFGLPELRIPWLEFSQPFVVTAFFLHALLDWMLMFNIGVPIPSLYSPCKMSWPDRTDSPKVTLANMAHRLSEGLLRPRTSHLGA